MGKGDDGIPRRVLALPAEKQPQKGANRRTTPRFPLVVVPLSLSRPVSRLRTSGQLTPPPPTSPLI